MAFDNKNPKSWSGSIGAISLLEFAQAEDWLVRQRLAEALGHLPSPKTESALRYLAKDAHYQVAEAARISLQRLSDRVE